MSAPSRLSFGLVAAGMLCLLLTSAYAQQATQLDSATNDPDTARQPGRAASPQADPSATSPIDRSIGETNQNRTNFRAAQAAAGSGNPVDHFLAVCLLSQNKGEVELSKIAQQGSENPAVKQFAEKMIQDHQKMIDQLHPLVAMQGAANRGVPSILGGNSEAQGRSESTVGRSSDTVAVPGSAGASQTIPPTGTSAAVPPATATAEAATPPAGAHGAIHELMRIDRQINERCLQMAREELQQKTGAEFDKCYVGNAIGAHAHALAALEVIGKETQGTLSQLARQNQSTVQQHLDHAKQLMKQLDGEAGATATQALRSTNRTE